MFQTPDFQALFSNKSQHITSSRNEQLPKRAVAEKSSPALLAAEKSSTALFNGRKEQYCSFQWSKRAVLLFSTVVKKHTPSFANINCMWQNRAQIFGAKSMTKFPMTGIRIFNIVLSMHGIPKNVSRRDRQRNREVQIGPNFFWLQKK